jgi:DNA-binding CsgD family transcriptional regulator
VTEPAQPSPLTPEEHRVMTLLRQGPQSLSTLARVMHMDAHQIDAIVRSLDGKVGLVPLCRSGTLCYGLAE